MLAKTIFDAVCEQADFQREHPKEAAIMSACRAKLLVISRCFALYVNGDMAAKERGIAETEKLFTLAESLPREAQQAIRRQYDSILGN